MYLLTSFYTSQTVKSVTIEYSLSSKKRNKVNKLVTTIYSWVGHCYLEIRDLSYQLELTAGYTYKIKTSLAEN